ncbi:MAG: hypothetical protein AB1716_10075 [Planctomycetota bacterium]
MRGAFSAQFTWIDWLVVVGYLVFTSWLGAKMAGRQATIRDFFLGGRKLPWWAVSGSIIATEISALTFISVPWVVFQPGGNLTYLQLGIFGSLFARILVGYLLVPAYYKREIYSPYDYMQNQLGGHVRSMTTALFVLSGMLAQSARIYLTALVVAVVLRDQLTAVAAALGGNELVWAIICMTAVSVGWTLIGGMTTVIWTDVVLFLAFLSGAVVALGSVIWQLDGGLAQMLREGWNAVQSGVPWAAWGEPVRSGAWGKFTFFDFSTSPVKNYTFWTAVIASTWGGLGAYGTDQLMAQRMFCCRSPREARWAIISSNVSQVVTILVALVGVGLFVYYQHHTPGAVARELLAERTNGDRIFPVFIVEVIPVGLKGLIIAAVFAAAISSVMGILTALSQTVMSAFYNPLRERALRRRGVTVRLAGDVEDRAGHTRTAEDRRSVLVSRLLVIFWGVALSLLAYGAQFAAAKYKAILDLGLALAGYAGGGLLAGFALGFLPLRISGRGYMWSAPLSVLYIFGLVWHQDWSHVVCWTGAVLLAATWVGALAGATRAAGSAPSHECTQRTNDSTAVNAAVAITYAARQPPAPPVLPTWAQTGLLSLGIAGMLLINYYGHFGQGPPDKFGSPTYRVLAFPWYVPIGSTIAFVWGWLLARRR